jgi:hypothetical protein
MITARIFEEILDDFLKKVANVDGTVKSSRGKARES